MKKLRKLMWWTVGFSLAISVYLEIIPFVVVAIIIISLWLLSYFRFGECEPISMLISSLLGGMFGTIYILSYTYLNISPLDPYDDLTISMSATVLDFPEVGDYGRYSVLADFDLGGKGVQTIFYGDEQLGQLKPGDIFQSMATFTSTAYTTKGLPTVYYYSQGTFLRGILFGDVEIVSTSGIKLKYLPVYGGKKVKDTLLTSFPEKYNGLALALVTGNKDELRSNFSSALTLTGLSHTVAVSGMHLAFLAGVVRTLLPRGKWWAFGIFSMVMVLFMLMSGSTPSIMRATVMILMLELAPFFSRDRDDPTSLSAAVFFILLNNPFAIHQVGLYLSIASVASIFLFSEYFRDKLMKFFAVEEEDSWFKTKRSVIATLATTCAAMIFTTPILGMFFDRVSLIAPIANIFALWAISLLFVGCLLVACVGSIVPILGQVFGLLYILLFEYLLLIVPLLARSPFASISVHSIYYKYWLYFVYLLIFLAIIVPKEKKLRYPVALALVTLLLSSVLHLENSYHDGLKVQVLDVGQGQSALFQLGTSLILSDCGGNSWNNSGNLAADAINDLGRIKLDLLVISHCDADHVNGVITLMDRIWVDTIAMPPLDYEDILQVEIVTKALQEGTNLLFVEEKMEWKVAEEQFVTLFPPVGAGGANERGISLLVTSGSADALVLGDMNANTELLFLERFDLPSVEVLFMPHHGSKYSSSDLLLERVTDKIGIICVGTNNYGHPTREVLEKMELNNMEIFRTDTMGALTLELAS